MEILKNFGFNPILLLAQIVNFLILLYLLKRFMYKPVLDMIKKREEAVKLGLKQADEGKKILEEAEEKQKELFKKAQIQADKIIQNAKLESEEIKTRLEENTKRETERMLEEAKVTIQQEAKATEAALTRKVGELAVSLLEKSLSGVFEEKEQKLFLKKAIAQINKQKV